MGARDKDCAADRKLTFLLNLSPTPFQSLSPWLASFKIIATMLTTPLAYKLLCRQCHIHPFGFGYSPRLDGPHPLTFHPSGWHSSQRPSGWLPWLMDSTISAYATTPARKVQLFSQPPWMAPCSSPPWGSMKEQLSMGSCWPDSSPCTRNCRIPVQDPKSHLPPRNQGHRWQTMPYWTTPKSRIPYKQDDPQPHYGDSELPPPPQDCSSSLRAPWSNGFGHRSYGATASLSSGW